MGPSEATIPTPGSGAETVFNPPSDRQHVPGSGNPSGPLGYHFQLRHALDALWEVAKHATNASVQVEGIDDFEISGWSDSVVQTKNHAVGSISDRSKDLWKTLANWSNLELAGNLPADAQLILITTAAAGDGTVAAALAIPERSTKTNRELAARLDKIAEEATPSLKASYKAYRSLGEKQRVTLVGRIRVLEGSPPLNAMEIELGRHVRGSVDPSVVDSIVREVEGWFVMRILGLLALKKPAVVTATQLVGKTYDVILAHGPEALPELQVDEWDGVMPTDREFVKALAKVQAHATRQREAVRAAYLAEEHRLRWHRRALVREGELDEYEEKVRKKWEMAAAQTLQGEPYPCPTDHYASRGRDLLKWAENDRSVLLRASAPDFVQPGFTHLLADKKRVAWHMEDVARILGEAP